LATFQLHLLVDYWDLILIVTAEPIFLWLSKCVG